MRYRHGDTIVEVMFAFSVFSLVVVSAIILMNKGLALAQRSLEITLVRQQIDAQVAMVQHAQQMGPASAIWSTLRAGAGSAPAAIGSITTCPDSGALATGDNYFIASKPDKSDIVAFKIAAANYRPASTYALVDIFGQVNPQQTSYGIWLSLAKADNNGANDNPAYDLYVRACWYSVGESRPTVIGTVVRLYDTN